MSEHQNPERLGVQVARTVDDIERLRAMWETVPWLRDEAEWDLFLARIRSRPGVIRPFAVLADAAGAAGRIESRDLRTNVGYRVLYAPAVRMLRVVDGGLVASDAATAAPILAALESALGSGEADAITFPALPVHSELFAAVCQLGGPLERQHFLRTSVRRTLTLPDTFEDFLASRSRKTRFGIRYDAGKLLEALGEELRVEILHEPSSFERLVHDLDHVARSTYQRAAGAGFADTPEERAVTRVGLEHGWVRAYVLYRREEPIAYWLCSVHRGTILLKTTGFDHAYASRRVGVYLLMRVIEDACADPSLEVLDFGPGDAPYKRHFSSESFEERSIVVFAPTFRGRRINAVRTAILGSALLARRAADATDLTERIKARWRGRLRERR